MELFGGCESSCASCRSVNNGSLSQNTLRPKLCSWAEEEIGLDHGNDAIGLDFGFLGRLVNSGGFPRLGGSNPKALYPVGALMPVRSIQEGPRAASSVKALYQLDPVPFGRGSYGEVYAATHRRSGARRAVKTVGKEALRRYVRDVGGFVRREVDIMRRLDHPNVCRLYEAFEDQTSITMVLEFCDGGDLLERVTVAQDRLPERAAASLMIQMLSSIQHLFLRGIVHRDLKPENFLFARREPSREPLPPEVAPLKLIDFGLSKRLDAESGARLTPKIGTTEYMAPEAFAGRVKPGLADRTDVWSLGVVLHVIFIGHFPSPSLGEVSPEEYLQMPCWEKVSSQAKHLLALLLKQDPRLRPSAAVALRHPWLQMASSQHVQNLCRSMPLRLEIFTEAVQLRRLALAAAARELDDGLPGSHVARRLFQDLELQCGGDVTQAALEKASDSPGYLGKVAAELAAAFHSVDMDGSGSIDWTELLAALLCRPEEEDHVCAPDLTNDACWRAFDLLSQGAGTVSAPSICHLISISQVEAPSAEQRQEVTRQCDEMMTEVVEGRGGLNYQSFVEVIKGM